MTKIVNAAEIDISVKGTQSIKEMNAELQAAEKNLKDIEEQHGKNSNEYKDAKSKLDALTGSIEKLNTEAKNLNDDSLKKVNEQTKEMKQGFSDAGQAGTSMGGSISGTGQKFSAFGLVLKGLGIGLIIKAFQWFTETLGKNQRVVDAVNTAFNFLSLVFNDFINLVLDNVKPVADSFKAIFENPKESIKSFGESIKNNIIERFNSFLEMTSHLGKALMHLFKGEFKEAVNSAKEAALESVDMFTGVDDSARKIANGVSEMGSAIADYTKRNWQAAKSITALEKASRTAVVEQQRLVEVYDRQAEKLRQLRDNDLESIDARIKANNDLAEVLDKQEKAMLGAANAQIAAAQAQVALNNSDENRVALIEAQANKEGVLAQIEGFRSEQKMNAIALQKEQMQLEERAIEAKDNLLIKEKEFNASLIEDDKKRLDAEREILEQEKIIEQERLQNKVNSYKEGTMARLEAEIELKTRMQEIGQAIIQNEKDRAALEVQVEKEKEEAKATAREQAAESINAFSNLVGEIGQSVLKNQKAQALIQVGIDTASAISSLVKMSQANPANAVTAGGAGIAQFAAGILQIGTNMAKAVNILKAPLPPLPPPPGDLQSDAPVPQTPQPQGQQRVFVLETDITSTQQRVVDLLDIGVVG